ncbi:MAG: hypothetical protein LBU89_05115 [Fibromonadaceae bacterium]|jgi:hypothetical protein|nr:hypothetical protein [Fibromonadaceae bacterium]
MRKFLLLYICIGLAFAGNNISFNTIFLDTTGQFSITYPVALPNSAALSELQKNFIRQKFGEKSFGQEPLAALNQFVKNKEIKFLSDAVSFPLPGVVQYETSLYEHKGGAHGISVSDVGIYRIADGKKIELGNIFIKNWEKDVVDLIIKEFLLSQNLRSLSDYTYTQKESDFIPSSIRIVGGGLEFLYPIYKIGPHAAGEQSVFLSWNTLKPYLNKNSVIFSKIKF